MDEYGRFDLKECADALSEVIAKAKEKAGMPKFSELSGDRELMVYTGGECAYTRGCTPDVLTKEELLQELRNGWKNARDIAVYLAEKNIAQFDEDDIRSIVENMMESAEQYEDWDEAMMADIRDSAETKAFLQYLNGRAEANATYDAGLRVEMDCEVRNRE
ncbi:MAG: hypothetical protein KH197_03210 [Clostridiales bacterium]|nr:hypothetical protein [Clostridiales bacterium]